MNDEVRTLILWGGSVGLLLTLLVVAYKYYMSEEKVRARDHKNQWRVRKRNQEIDKILSKYPGQNEVYVQFVGKFKDSRNPARDRILIQEFENAVRQRAEYMISRDQAVQARVPKESQRDGRSVFGLDPLILLVPELLEIGGSVGFIASGRKFDVSGNPIGDSTPPTGFNEKWRNIRAVEIGQAISRMGGFDLMLRAHDLVKQELGAQLARHLEACWGGVGDWRA